MDPTYKFKTIFYLGRLEFFFYLFYIHILKVKETARKLRNDPHELSSKSHIYWFTLYVDYSWQVLTFHFNEPSYQPKNKTFSWVLWLTLLKVARCQHDAKNFKSLHEKPLNGPTRWSTQGCMDFPLRKNWDLNLVVYLEKIIYSGAPWMQSFFIYF